MSPIGETMSQAELLTADCDLQLFASLAIVEFESHHIYYSSFPFPQFNFLLFLIFRLQLNQNHNMENNPILPKQEMEEIKLQKTKVW